jgi:hypothetical protein
MGSLLALFSMFALVSAVPIVSTPAIADPPPIKTSAGRGSRHSDRAIQRRAQAPGGRVTGIWRRRRVVCGLAGVVQLAGLGGDGRTNGTPTGDLFIAGRWVGQVAASGQAAVASGIGDTGERAALFGIEPMFRDHPKDLYSRVANALY